VVVAAGYGGGEVIGKVSVFSSEREEDFRPKKREKRMK
jgi:hypothetical protein